MPIKIACGRCGAVRLSGKPRRGRPGLCRACWRAKFPPPQEEPRPIKQEPPKRLDPVRALAAHPTPSPFLISQIYWDARKAVGTFHNQGKPELDQGYHRRVSAEFHRRLKEVGVSVEGA